MKSEQKSNAINLFRSRLGAESENSRIRESETAGPPGDLLEATKSLRAVLETLDRENRVASVPTVVAALETVASAFRTEGVRISGTADALFASGFVPEPSPKTDAFRAFVSGLSALVSNAFRAAGARSFEDAKLYLPVRVALEKIADSLSSFAVREKVEKIDADRAEKIVGRAKKTRIDGAGKIERVRRGIGGSLVLRVLSGDFKSFDEIADRAAVYAFRARSLRVSLGAFRARLEVAARVAGVSPDGLEKFRSVFAVASEFAPLTFELGEKIGRESRVFESDFSSSAFEILAVDADRFEIFRNFENDAPDFSALAFGSFVRRAADFRSFYVVDDPDPEAVDANGIPVDLPEKIGAVLVSNPGKFEKTRDFNRDVFADVPAIFENGASAPKKGESFAAFYVREFSKVAVNAFAPLTAGRKIADGAEIVNDFAFGDFLKTFGGPLVRAVERERFNDFNELNAAFCAVVQDYRADVATWSELRERIEKAAETIGVSRDGYEKFDANFGKIAFVESEPEDDDLDD